MNDDLKVSVVIPAYNGAPYICKSINSVLNQTYSNFELIVVDDASTDETSILVQKIHDNRVRYILHEKNMGVNQARNTGVEHSTGDLIALLDQDDYFHPDKLQRHVSLFRQSPDIGITYNARFELNYSADTIREIWRPPCNISLADLVLWFPIAPSDILIKRQWVRRVSDLTRGLSWTGGEIAVFGSLFLDGCKFAFVNQALNYRRHHSKRKFKNLIGGCASEINCQTIIFDDPRCPPQVQALRNVAHANIYMFWAYRSFAQDETDIGQGLLRKAVEWNPNVIVGYPCELVNFLTINSSDDENINHATLLKRIFAQFPTEMVEVSNQLDWAISRGYLLRAERAVMWGRSDDGKRLFEHAIALHASIDQTYIDQLVQNVLNYEKEFGETAAHKVLSALLPYIRALGEHSHVRQLLSKYAVNLALDSYQNGEFDNIPKIVLTSIVNDPKYIFNRGVLAIFLQSIIKKFNKRS
jgi:glycosyltransferase involved in cell wall biosynthesis